MPSALDRLLPERKRQFGLDWAKHKKPVTFFKGEEKAESERAEAFCTNPLRYGHPLSHDWSPTDVLLSMLWTSKGYPISLWDKRSGGKVYWRNSKRMRRFRTWPHRGQPLRHGLFCSFSAPVYFRCCSSLAFINIFFSLKTFRMKL